MSTTLRIAIDDGALMPKRAYDTDAGLDLLSPFDARVPAMGSVIIDTGIHVEIPKGYVGMLKSKSGMNIKGGITSEGVIDSGYTGSIVCKLYNHTNEIFRIHKGDKITQLVILPIITPRIEVVNKVNGGKRGDNGFGSTGK